ncbi:MAG: hypothetical protein ACLFUJ_05190 [Phycisphaerae bacterium]
MKHRTGSVYICAILALLILTSLSISLIGQASMNHQMSTNQADVVAARMAAESGMEYMIMQVSDIVFEADTTDSNVMDRLKTSLSVALDSDGQAGALSLSQDKSRLAINPRSLDVGVFYCSFQQVDDPDDSTKEIVMSVTGSSNGVSRDISMRLDLTDRSSNVFGYGFASKGKIEIGGSATIEEINDPKGMKMLSTLDSAPAIAAGGSADIKGSLYLTGESEDFLSLKGGGYEIAGESSEKVIREKYVHLGTEIDYFPEVDTSPFVTIATNYASSLNMGDYSDENVDYVDDTGKKAKGSAKNVGTLVNMTVEPNENPKFNNATIKGVLCIKYPNEVHFHGKTTIEGVIVTEQGPSDSGSDKKKGKGKDKGSPIIVFHGQTSAKDPSGLDATDTAYTEVRKHTGTVILAPGFDLQFRGNTNAISGTIAADSIEFRGNSGTEADPQGINGVILGLDPGGVSKLGGSSHVKMNLSNNNDKPAGFKLKQQLVFDPNSYSE